MKVVTPTGSTPLDGRPLARASIGPFGKLRAGLGYSWLPAFARLQLERLRASPMRRRLARGVFWSLAGAGVSRLLGLAASIFVARWLGAERFGELGIVQSTVGVFGMFAGLGLGLTATRHVAEFREKDPAKAGRILAMSVVVAAGCGCFLTLLTILFAGPLVQHALAASHLAGVLRIGAVTIFLGALNGVQTGALSGFEAFKTIARINLWSGLASVPLMLAGVWWGGLNGVVWGWVAGQALNCWLNHLALRSEGCRAEVPIEWKGWAQEWPTLWRFSLPALLCSVMILPVNWAGMTLLVHQPGGYEEMGLFNAANQWRVAILFVPQTLAGIVLPALAGLDPTGERARYAKLFWTNVALVGAVALVLALGVIAAAGWILRGYGHGFSGGRELLVLLSLAAVVMAINQVLGTDVISQNRMWAGLVCNSVWAMTFLGLAAWLVPAHGARGLAWSILASYPVHSGCLLILNLHRPLSAGRGER